MKISTLALPFLLLAPGIAHAASDLLSGTVRVGTGELLPITKLRAEIWACSPGIFRWCTWSYVVSINTDESGSFRYTSSPNVPPNTSWSIHLVGANDAAEFNDGGWFGWAPSLVTPIPLGGGGREVFFNTVITDTTWSARLKNLEVIRTGRMYANSNRDPREGDPIPIVSLSPGSATRYDATTDQIVVGPNGTSHAPLYEYAYFVLRHISRFSGTSPTTHDVCLPAPASTRESAWASGFGYFFVRAAMRTRDIGGFGDLFGTSNIPMPSTIEDNALCAGNPALGVSADRTPLNIGAALFDAFDEDTQFEPGDRLHGQGGQIFQIVDRELSALGRDATLADFYEAFVARGLDRVFLDQVLVANGFTPRSITPIDGYDSDQRADFVVFRGSQQRFHFINSSTGQPHSVPFGEPGDLPVPGDYDGDGRTDVATWRPSDGTWRVRKTANEGFVAIQQWGTLGDIPVPGDYDGDGRTDFAVWRPSDGTWIFIDSTDGVPHARQWGTAGDIPVPADYDGDGVTDFAIWRPSTAAWCIIESRTNMARVTVFGFVGYGDRPVPADYDGDGDADLAFYHPTNGAWWVRDPATGAASIFWSSALGSSEVLVPRDYDGDGAAEIVHWAPSTGIWTNDGSFASPRFTPLFQQWGQAGDIPAPAK